jgi:hypothetical protein
MSTRRKHPRRPPVYGTGIKIEAVSKYGKDVPVPPPGVHMWVITGCWEIKDPTPGAPVILDTENLLSLGGPGCFACEQAWTPQIAALPCPGDPSGHPW